MTLSETEVLSELDRANADTFVGESDTDVESEVVLVKLSSPRVVESLTDTESDVVRGKLSPRLVESVTDPTASLVVRAVATIRVGASLTDMESALVRANADTFVATSLIVTLSLVVRVNESEDRAPESLTETDSVAELSHAPARFRYVGYRATTAV